MSTIKPKARLLFDEAPPPPETPLLELLPLIGPVVLAPPPTPPVFEDIPPLDIAGLLWTS